MNHFLKIVIAGFLVVLAPASYAKADALDETLATVAPEILLVTILNQVQDAYRLQGSDFLQSLLRHYATEGVNIDQLRKEVLESHNGQPAVLLVSGTPYEVDVANKVMSESGFDFIQFKNGDSQMMRAEIQKPHKRWAQTGFVFGLAMLAGALQVFVQQEAARDQGQPLGDFMAQLRPYIGMAVGGGLLSLPQLNGRFRSAIKDTIWNLLTPVGLVVVAHAVAAYPANPVHYESPSPLQLALSTVLYLASVAGTRISLNQFNRQGALDAIPRDYEASVRYSSKLALVLGLVATTSWFGQLAQLGLISVSSGRFWLKLKWADSLYRRRTANILSAEKYPMTRLQSICARMTDRLGRLTFTRAAKRPQ